MKQGGNSSSNLGVPKQTGNLQGSHDLAKLPSNFLERVEEVQQGAQLARCDKKQMQKKN